MGRQVIAGVKRRAERDGEQISSKRPRNENVLRPLVPRLMAKPALDALPEHVNIKLFYYLPINSLGEMALASKTMCTQVLRYLTSGAYAQRVAQMLNNYDTDIMDTCHDAGIAIKRATFLLPVSLRLKHFLQFTDELSTQLVAIEEHHKREEDYEPVCRLKCVGEMLLKFVDGWADDECTKAFKLICDHYEITQAIAHFLDVEPGENLENEMFLRRHLRELFLDPFPCDNERATWIGIIAGRMSTAQLAKVLLLLYGPLNNEGHLHWTFPFDARAFEIYTPVFMRLGRIVGILHLTPNWSKHLTLEVLVYMSNTPNCWLLRSFAAMLLPMNAYDNNVILEYFNILYKSDRMATASLLMALVLLISPHYIKYSCELLNGSHIVDTEEDEYLIDNVIVFDSKCVFRFIQDVIKHPQFSKQYDIINTKLWETFSDLARDFTAAFVYDEDEERGAQSRQDYRSLMDALNDYTRNILLNGLLR